MNKLVALVCFFSLSVKAQVVFEKTLDIAFEKAEKQNKPVFIKYYNSDCSVCTKFSAILNTDNEVIDFYNSNFINYALNTKDVINQNEELVLKNANLHFEVVPMAVFFDANRQFIHYSDIKINPEYIIAIGKTALNPNLRTAALASKYNKGDQSVKTLYAYAEYLVVTKNEALLQKVTNNLFDAFKKEELPTKKSYIVLKNVIHSTENGFFQYWVNHLEDLKNFETGHKEGSEKEILISIVIKELSDSKRKNWPLSKKDKYKKYIKDLNMSDNPDSYFE